MTDIKRADLYSELAKTSYKLGRDLGGRKLPNINMGTPSVSSPDISLPNISGGSGSQIYNQWKQQYPETTKFGGSTLYERGGTHQGVDIAMPQGTPIKSLTSGTVVESQTGQTQDQSRPSFGNYIIVKTPDNKYVRYSHLDQVWKNIVGTEVKPGDVLGSEGNTGSTYSQQPGGSGAHLDLRIWELWNNQKKYINPDIYFANS